MQVINEINKNGSTCYERLFKEKNGKITFREEIVFPSFTRERNGYLYLLLYDKHFQLITEAFGFLNDKRETIATRRQALSALKLLFTFSTIIGKEISEFTQNDIKSLKDFLHGISYGGSEIQFNLVQMRNNETINLYLGVYRKYCTFLGRKNEALEQKKTRKMRSETIPSEKASAPYQASERIPKEKEVPRYISVDEFRKILTVIRSDYTLREEIIVRLMYENGLRIGEVLGLTWDDVVCEKIESIGYVCFAYLRNRVSDNPIYQSAKGCMKVKSIKDYKTSEYKTLGYGFERVVLSHELYDLINDYIEEAHAEAMSRNKERYLKSITADRVRKEEKFEDPNYYIFLNDHGGRLSQQVWNGTLRQIFEKCGILVDEDKKKHNLNHRFRHGFAMYRIEHGCDLLKLKELLRHRSPESTKIYSRPTTADTIKLKNEYHEMLFRDIPELKKREI